MDALVRDLSYAVRTLRKNPGFSVFAALTLALGIGANSAIFTVVNGVLLRPLPFPEPDRLMTLWQDHRAVGGPDTEWASPPNFLDWQARSRAFEAMAAVGGWSPTLLGGNRPERLQGVLASADIFAVLGVPLERGRGFSASEDRPGGPFVVVVSHRLWQTRFGGGEDVLGRTLTLNGLPHTVVGVLSSGAGFVPMDGIAEAPDVWAPIRLDTEGCGRGCVTLRVVGRLAPGVGVDAARAEMAAIVGALAADHPENRGVGSTVIPLKAYLTGPVRPALFVLAAAVGFVLLIACANVANLLMARGAAREAELAIRAALGAGRGRLMRQLLTESVVLAVAGGTLGLLLAMWGVDLLTAAVPGNARVPRLASASIDATVLGFTVAISVATGIVFGVLPSWRSTSPRLTGALEGGRRGRASRSAHARARNSLVVGEVAVAVVLLVGAGLLVRSFVRLTRVDAGFDPGNTLVVDMFLPEATYPSGNELRGFVRAVVDRAQRLPGVRRAAAGSAVPMGGGDADADFGIDGAPPRQRDDPPRVAWYRQVTPGYFETLRIPLRRGRAIDVRDHADAPDVVVINETLARVHFPGREPVGRYLVFGSRRAEIVGVASDVKSWGLAAAARPAVYLSHDQFPSRNLTLAVRTAADPTAVAEAVRGVIGDLDPTLAAGGITTLDAIVAGSIGAERVTAGLLGLFAVTALLLAAVGLYGVLTYTVTRRTREIGIRMALGADPTSLRAGVVGRGMALAALGWALGLALAFALGRLMASLLFGVTPTDPVTFAAVTAVLTVVAWLACYLPARRATRVDPAAALRAE